MIKKIWVIGDSFSVPVGLVPYTNRSNELIQDYFEGRHEKDAWYNVVGRALKCSTIDNTSQAGGTNMEILTFLVQIMPFIQPDDQVILGLTNSDRIEYTWRDRPLSTAFRTFTSPIHIITSSDIPKIKELQGDVFYSDSYHLLDHFINREYHSGEYMHYQHYPIFKLAMYIFERLCKNIIIWHPSLWEKYENITTMTEGKVEDRHWSPKGNKEFADTILPWCGKGFKVFIHDKIYDDKNIIEEEYLSPKRFRWLP